MSKLILTHEVSGLGSAGDIVDVKNGYARNYLIPQGFAIAWTRGGEKQVEQIKSARAAREHATIEEAQDLKSKLEAATVKPSGRNPLMVRALVGDSTITTARPSPPLSLVAARFAGRFFFAVAIRRSLSPSECGPSGPADCTNSPPAAARQARAP